MRIRLLFVALMLTLLSGCARDEKPFHIGIQLYSVRGDLQQDFTGTLQKIKDMGYEGVEFFDDFGGRSPEQVRQICDEIGLEIFSNHFPYQRVAADLDGVIRDSRTLGLRYITIPSLPGRPGADPERFRALASPIGEFARKAAEAGFSLLYHNHDFEFETLPDGQTGYDFIFASGAPEQLGSELDVCWADYAGVDVPALIRRYSGRVPVVHIKDYSRDLSGLPRGRRVDFRPLGAGVMDLPAVIEAARESGSEWLCVEQDEPAAGAADRFEGPAESARYLREAGLL